MWDVLDFRRGALIPEVGEESRHTAVDETVVRCSKELESALQASRPHELLSDSYCMIRVRRDFCSHERAILPSSVFSQGSASMTITRSK